METDCEYIFNLILNFFQAHTTQKDFVSFLLLIWVEYDCGYICTFALELNVILFGHKNKEKIVKSIINISQRVSENETEKIFFGIWLRVWFLK